MSKHSELGSGNLARQKWTELVGRVLARIYLSVIIAGNMRIMLAIFPRTMALPKTDILGPVSETTFTRKISFLCER
jgi:hypothetical protein